MTDRRLFSAGLLTLGLALSGCSTAGAPPAAASGASAGSYIAGIRANAGLPALAQSATLERAARTQAGYMAGNSRMSHTTGFGRDFASRLRQAGIRGPAAENVAHGQQDIGQVFQAWMNSAGHRRNLLDPAFGHYGLAYSVDGAGRKYWALVLAP